MGYRPTKLDIRIQKYESAVKKCHWGLVIFGRGHDLVIYISKKRRGTGYAKPNTYSVPTGCTLRNHCNFFAGSSPFNLSDIELFYLSLS